MCPNRLLNLRHYLYDNSEIDSIATLFPRVSDVGLGYTLSRAMLKFHDGSQYLQVCTYGRETRVYFPLATSIACCIAWSTEIWTSSIASSSKTSFVSMSR